MTGEIGWQMDRSWRVFSIALGLAVVLLAACSGRDDATPASSTTTTTEKSTTSVTSDDPNAAHVGDVATGPAVPSPGCSGDPLTDVVTAYRHDIRVGRDDRWYLLSTPPLTDDHAPVPLVVDLHGLTEGADIHALMTRLGELGQQEGFAVVFPQGSGQPVRWNSDATADPNKDLDMIDAVLDQVGQERCIDLSRVYATGLSSGALMTSTLACVRSDRFAAVAPVDGVVMPEPCESSRPVPLLSFHGTADPILPFDGGPANLAQLVTPTTVPGGDTDSTTTIAPPDLDGPGYPANAAAWAAHNGCGAATDEKVGDEVVHRVYDCPVGADVEFYIVLGGGHSWPSSHFSDSISAVVGHTTFDVDASLAIWQFFERFRLPL